MISDELEQQRQVLVAHLHRLRPEVEWVNVALEAGEAGDWLVHVFAREGPNWGVLDVPLERLTTNGPEATARFIAETIDLSSL
jgi:hypothetical protein